MINKDRDWYEGCVNDQYWRLNHMYFILDKDGNIRRFKMNWAQQQLYQGMHTRMAILKARQLGMSTFTSILMLDNCIHRPNFKAGIIDKSLPDGEEKIGKMRFALQCMLEPPLNITNDHVEDANTRTRIMHHCQCMAREVVHKAPGEKGYKLNDTVMSQKATFANGSQVLLGTSLRGGTLQMLHVSEFGWIANNNPGKATEILSGGVNAVNSNGMVIIESTHEGGKYGANYRIMKQAMENQGKKLMPLEWKFYFFPWWKQREYSLPGEGHDEFQDEYFESLGEQNIELTEEQKRWYCVQSQTFGYRVKTEYPSTPDEAFTQQVEGSLYGSIISKLRSKGRMSAEFEVDAYTPMYVSWDLGSSDYTAMWLFQPIAGRYYIIDYYCANDKPESHYIDKVREWEKEHGKQVNLHLLPHDASFVREMGNPMSSVEMKLITAGLPTVVIPRISNIWNGVYLVKDILQHCTFHQRCSLPVVVDGIEYMSGVDALENYQVGKTGAQGVERVAPLHDATSHGADSFRYIAEGVAAGFVTKENVGRVYDVVGLQDDDMTRKPIVCRGVPKFWRKETRLPISHISNRKRAW